MFSVGDIAELEHKYSKYIFKKRLRIFILFTVLIIIALSATYFFMEYKKVSKKNKNFITKIKQKKTAEKNNTLSNINTITTKAIKNNSLKIARIDKNDTNITNSTKTPLVKDNETNIISKNIATNDKIIQINKVENNETKNLVFHLKPSDDLSFEDSNRGTLTLNIPTFNVQKKIPKPVVSKKINKNDTITKLDIVKPNIKIEMNDIDSIKYLKDKFNLNHNIIFALMLCEEYYSKKDFQNSLKWSMIANDIDNGSERSWIWFAKSKYRLNQKKDAIEALRAYLKSNDSATVRSLLHDIITGELND